MSDAIEQWVKTMELLRYAEQLARIDKILSSHCSESDRAHALLAQTEVQTRIQDRSAQR